MGALAIREAAAMHGMVNRALQGFLTSTYGDAVWAEVRSQAGLPFDDFEAMLSYPDPMTSACFEAASHVLHKDHGTLLEDFGIWLVTDPNLEPVRRLLRFSGARFEDFLHALEDLDERGRLVLPALDLPRMTVSQLGDGRFVIDAAWSLAGVSAILTGCLRAMADDYGTLAFVSLAPVAGDGHERLEVQLFDATHSKGRCFELGQVCA
ncbi:MAG: heme NO-binding domain-containing protein [Proteobacteria bacterium]|nr:heme NO-binding domain-containing protein [Pseudomonadota bacterium]